MASFEAAAEAAAIAERLGAIAVAARAEKEKAYLKSDLVHLGVSVAAIRRIATEVVRAWPHLPHDEVVGLVTALWDATPPVHELRLAAVEVLEQSVAVLDRRDLPLLGRLVRESRTWALVDALAAGVLGPLATRDGRVLDDLDGWAADADFWVRRAALLAPLRALRSGGGDFARWARMADRMLEDREFFIRKAIGWVLRDTGRRRPDLVFDWFAPRAARASGVTTREVAKVLSDEQRAVLGIGRR